MPLFFVTGMPGAGKTSICEYLKNNSQATACDVDDGFAGHFDQAGLEQDHWEPDFLFLLLPDKIAQLKKESANADVFLCGNISRPENYFPLFDKVVFLSVSLDLLQERLHTRSNNPFGKDPESLQAVIDHYPSTNRFWNKSSETNMKVKIVDASLPLKEVADEVACFCTDGKLLRKSSHQLTKSSAGRISSNAE